MRDIRSPQLSGGFRDLVSKRLKAPQGNRYQRSTILVLERLDSVTQSTSIANGSSRTTARSPLWGCALQDLRKSFASRFTTCTDRLVNRALRFRSSSHRDEFFSTKMYSSNGGESSRARRALPFNSLSWAKRDADWSSSAPRVSFPSPANASTYTVLRCWARSLTAKSFVYASRYF